MEAVVIAAWRDGLRLEGVREQGGLSGAAEGEEGRERAQDTSDRGAVLADRAGAGAGAPASAPETRPSPVDRGRIESPSALVDHAATLVDQAAIALALVHARAEAGTDSVTGCMNHRAMRRRILEEIGRAQRSTGRLSCMLLDLDDFKLVNDRHGHGAGDAVLREVAQALMGEFRAFDRVARYGGDEFVAILPEADLESAVAAAGRALERLRNIALPSVPEGVFASIGVAEW